MYTGAHTKIAPGYTGHAETHQHAPPAKKTKPPKIDMNFLGMTKAKLMAFFEENPASVDDWDTRGETALCAAAWKHDAQLVAWLVEEKGASVHRTTDPSSCSELP